MTCMPVSTGVIAPMAIDNLADERLAIYHALLGAAAGLSKGADPAAILCQACDALIEASPHIRLAWMYLGDPDVPVVRPAYAVGEASAYAHDLVLDSSPQSLAGPTRHSLSEGIPVLNTVRSNPEFHRWRAKALQYGLEASLSLPFGAPRGSMRGVVALYTDCADYFDQVGLEPFSAFAHLAATAVEQADLRQHLKEAATIDSLTGLLRRGAIKEILECEHERAVRYRRCYSILLIDLDRFKLINDSYGHGCGDDLLAAVAQAGGETLRQGDWLGRWGGEEFLVLLPETDQPEAYSIAERLRAHIARVGVAAGGDTVSTTASIGLASWSPDCESLDQLLMQADVALYEAKKNGRDRVGGSEGAAGTVTFAMQLNTALAADRVIPAYQSIVELATGHQVADKALARLVLPGGELAEAQKLINGAVKLAIAHKVEFKILSNVIRRCVARLREDEAPFAHFVGASIDLLRHHELVRDLLDMAGNADAPVQQRMERDRPMVIEIAESEFLEDAGLAKKLLAPLLDFGFRLAIGDFGSGRASFRYLADLPVSFLKIDGELVRRAAAEARVRKIIGGIHAIAAELGVITIAEYVENAVTADVLRDIGVNWGQGAFFGMPAMEAEQHPPVALP